MRIYTVSFGEYGEERCMEWLYWGDILNHDSSWDLNHRIHFRCGGKGTSQDSER